MNQQHTANSIQKQTEQHHRQQAGEHRENALESHKEAAKLHGSGDHQAGDQDAKITQDHTGSHRITQDHTEKADQHVANIGKKNHSGTPQKKIMHCRLPEGGMGVDSGGLVGKSCYHGQASA